MGETNTQRTEVGSRGYLVSAFFSKGWIEGWAPAPLPSPPPALRTAKNNDVTTVFQTCWSRSWRSTSTSCLRRRPRPRRTGSRPTPGSTPRRRRRCTLRSRSSTSCRRCQVRALLSVVSAQERLGRGNPGMLLRDRSGGEVGYEPTRSVMCERMLVIGRQNKANRGMFSCMSTSNEHVFLTCSMLVDPIT